MNNELKLLITMPVYFQCEKCGLTVTHEEYELSKFCPECRTFLFPRRIISDIKPTRDIEKTEIRRENVDVESLFYEYMQTKPIDAGGGVAFKDVESWINARKKIYKKYSDVFSLENLQDTSKITSEYENWLLFRNNLSWTTLHRTGYYATKTPKRLVNLIRLLQNETIDIESRVYKGLKGNNKVYGIGQGILTAILHTLFSEKYGVWNSRTKDTLEILRRTPIRRRIMNIGQTYKNVNKELIELAKELRTDLTYLDGFMWYISKFVVFL